MPDTSIPGRQQPGPTANRLRLADHRPLLVSLALVLVAAAAFGATHVADVALRYSTMRPLHEIAVPRGDDGAVAFDPERARETVGGMDIAAEALYLPPLVVLRVLSLGYQSAWADLLFVRAHAYFLTHFFSDRKFTWLDHYYEAIKGLDPDNPRLYQWAGQVVKFGQHINDGVITRANGYLEEGLQRFPNDWQIGRASCRERV